MCRFNSLTTKQIRKEKIKILCFKNAQDFRINLITELNIVL